MAVKKRLQVHAYQGDEQGSKLGRIFLLTDAGKPNIINSFHRCRGAWVSVYPHFFLPDESPRDLLESNCVDAFWDEVLNSLSRGNILHGKASRKPELGQT
jgi:hypothetical protein